MRRVRTARLKCEPGVRCRLPTGPMTTPDASWTVLARIVRPQGRRGEVIAELYTDFPHRFEQRRRLFLRRGPADDAPSPILLESHWLRGGRVVLKFAGVDGIGEAEKLRSCEVIIPISERMPLDAGAVYIADLLGCEVVDAGGDFPRTVGEIVDVAPHAVAPAMLVLRTGSGAELLIPFARSYILNLDLEARRLTLKLPADFLSMQDQSMQSQEAPRPAAGRHGGGDGPA